MDAKNIGKVDGRYVEVQSTGQIRLLLRDGKSIDFSIEQASQLAALLIKAVAYAQTENAKAMAAVPAAAKEMKKTADEVKEVTDRFTEIANA